MIPDVLSCKSGGHHLGVSRFYGYNMGNPNLEREALLILNEFPVPNDYEIARVGEVIRAPYMYINKHGWRDFGCYNAKGHTCMPNYNIRAHKKAGKEPEIPQTRERWVMKGGNFVDLLYFYGYNLSGKWGERAKAMIIENPVPDGYRVIPVGEVIPPYYMVLESGGWKCAFPYLLRGKIVIPDYSVRICKVDRTSLN